MIESKLVQHEITPRSTALLIVDVTQDFVAQGAPMEIPMAREILAPLRRLAEACRKAGGTVAYAGYAYRKEAMARMEDFWPPIGDGALAPKSEGVQIVHELTPEPDDIVVEKSTYSVFYETTLEDQLRERNIDTIVIGGVATNYACYLTAREAQCRRFKVVFLNDGACTFDLPDAGLGPVSVEDIQRTFLTTIAFGCGHVMSSKEVIRRFEPEEKP